MRTKIVSAVFNLRTDPKDKDILSFTIVGEIECAEESTSPCDRLSARRREEGYQPYYLTWKGTVSKRTIPFLCVGDN